MEFCESLPRSLHLKLASKELLWTIIAVIIIIITITITTTTTT